MTVQCPRCNAEYDDEGGVVVCQVCGTKWEVESDNRSWFTVNTGQCVGLAMGGINAGRRERRWLDSLDKGVSDGRRKDV